MKNQHSTSPFPVPSSFNTRILCLGNCCLCFSIRLKVSSHPSPILLEEMAKCWNPTLVSGFLLTLNAHTSLLISPSPQIALPTRLIYLYSLSCSWSANDPHSTVKEKKTKTKTKRYTLCRSHFTNSPHSFYENLVSSLIIYYFLLQAD